VLDNSPVPAAICETFHCLFRHRAASRLRSLAVDALAAMVAAVEESACAVWATVPTIPATCDSNSRQLFALHLRQYFVGRSPRLPWKCSCAKRARSASNSLGGRSRLYPVLYATRMLMMSRVNTAISPPRPRGSRYHALSASILLISGPHVVSAPVMLLASSNPVINPAAASAAR